MNRYKHKTSSRKMKEWERVDKLDVSVDEAMEVVKSMGIDVIPFCEGNKVGFEFTTPDSWIEEDDDRLAKAMKRGR